ncbi:MAG: hypothetical protein WBM40_19580 [Thiohalocapsa sp.]
MSESTRVPAPFAGIDASDLLNILADVGDKAAPSALLVVLDSVLIQLADVRIGEQGLVLRADRPKTPAVECVGIVGWFDPQVPFQAVDQRRATD